MSVPAPITRATHLTLREAVVEFKEREPRRHFPPTLRMGLPGRTSWAYVEAREDPLDHGLRTELAAALLCRCRAAGLPALAWLTRPGPLPVVHRGGAAVGSPRDEPVGHDADVAWGAAVRTAFAEAGVAGAFVIVTRHGWLDPVSGVGREWRRLRRYGARR